MKSIAPIVQFCSMDVVATDMKNMVKDWKKIYEDEFWLRIDNTGPISPVNISPAPLT